MALTLLIHVMLGGGLFAAGKLVDRSKFADVIEIEVVPPPRPKIERRPLPPPPAVEEPPAPVVDEKAKPPPDEPKVRRVQRPTPTTAPPVTDEPAAPGVNTDDTAPAPGPAIDMTGLMSDATGVPVENRKPTKRTGSGTGDPKGTNTGGGGAADSKGTSVAPVSVASIKTQAQPIGDTDYFNAGKDYPPDAKRLGVEGTVKVKLTISAEGRVVKRTLVTRLGHGLDELALQLAKKLTFDPAIDTDDKPVASILVWDFSFKLPK